MNKKPSLTYRDAGVDIERGDQLVEKIKGYAKSTLRPEVLGSIGGFAALCEIPKRYRQPILVSGTDGVGTKLKLAVKFNKFDTIGIDLVAMCVNDVLTLGAEPLFFLDYYATSKLDNEQAAAVIKGIAEGCRQAGCALIGGETAEMPGHYQTQDFDLAGFNVGIVEKDAIIDGRKVKAGDSLIALASSGPHSNGYSLIRHIIEERKPELTAEQERQLLEPTRIYVKSILALREELDIHAMAHITGGGIVENLPRVIPEGLEAQVNYSSWQQPEIFQWLQEQGNIAENEMRRTFNLGVGFIICIDKKDREKALALLKKSGENAWVLGEICKNSLSSS